MQFMDSSSPSNLPGSLSCVHIGLGQRFLQRFIAGPEEKQEPAEQGSELDLGPPRISSGHFEGEGVRGYAALRAEAATRQWSRSAEGSSHGPSRSMYVSTEIDQDVVRPQNTAKP